MSGVAIVAVYKKFYNYVKYLRIEGTKDEGFFTYDEGVVGFKRVFATGFFRCNGNHHWGGQGYETTWSWYQDPCTGVSGRCVSYADRSIHSVEL